jgi:hypothetical protein
LKEASNEDDDRIRHEVDGALAMAAVLNQSLVPAASAASGTDELAALVRVPLLTSHWSIVSSYDKRVIAGGVDGIR